MAEDYNDDIIEDPDSQVEDDEMSPEEAGFQKGAEEAAENTEKEEDEVK